MIEITGDKTFNGIRNNLGSSHAEVKIPKSIFITDFNEENSVMDFQYEFEECIQTGQSVIPIYIDSPGGDVSAVLGMIDIINKYKNKVIIATIASGFCASAGTLLLSAGTEGYRFASGLSQLMLHDLSTNISGKEEEVKTYTKYITKLQDLIYDLYDKNCNREPGFFKKYIKKTRNLDLYIDSFKAKEINLINYIGIPTFEVNITSKINILIDKNEIEE